MVFAMESQLIIDKQYMVWNGEKKNMYRLGIDIGTATVKFVLIDENKTIINAYNKYKQNNIFEEDVSEFIVNCFVTSIVAENNEMANRIRKIMEFQIKNN